MVDMTAAATPLTPAPGSLYRNAYALMAATTLSSLLGMGYWALAARLFPTAAVGQASAAISAMLLLANASQLNLSVGLMRFLPVSRGREGRLIATSYAVAFLAGTLLALAFLAVSDSLSENLVFLTESKFTAFLFVLGVSSWTTFALQDAVLTGMRAAVWVPVENSIFGLVKIGLLALAAVILTTNEILTSWVVPMVLIVIPVTWFIFRRVVPAAQLDDRPEHEAPTARHIVRFVGIDYIGTLLSHASMTTLPLLVIGFAGPEVSAVFYIAWTLGMAMDMVATSTSSSFLVEGSGRPEALAQLRRAATRRAALLLTPAALGVCLLADPILRVFGEDYRAGRWALVLLALAALPRMVLLISLAHLRVLRRVGTVVGLQALSCAVMLSLSVTALHFDLDSTGVAAAWLITQLVALGAALVVDRPQKAPPAGSAPAPARIR